MPNRSLFHQITCTFHVIHFPVIYITVIADDMELNPKFNIREDETMMLPDLTKPFLHSLAPIAPDRRTVSGVPKQSWEPVRREGE